MFVWPFMFKGWAGGFVHLVFAWTVFVRSGVKVCIGVAHHSIALRA